MGSSAGVLLLMLLLAAVVAWLVGRRPVDARRADRDADIDREVLEEAEEEVRDLDGMLSPEEADEELPDWGPGAPKR